MDGVCRPTWAADSAMRTRSPCGRAFRRIHRRIAA
nr:MAG TPA: hypothetical protein [Caudoviricetes sp.]